jgi:cytochrome d ubiquinol oxidase subunit II
MVFLQVIWFILIAVLLAGYAVLDGFDLGAGVLYPFIARNDEEKALVRDSVGPVWDGNEVWLLTGAGALFAAFPPVYATVFSGFYLALMLVLFALVFRAVSFEFRAQDPKWGGLWDWAFFGGSALPALLFGVAAGNIIRGVPLAAGGEYAGDFFLLLNPYALLCGVVGLVFFIEHGASWLCMKTFGDVRDRSAVIRRWGQYAYAGLMAVLAVTTYLVLPQRFAADVTSVFGWLGIVLAWGGVLGAIYFTSKDVDLWSFVASGASIVGLVVMWGAAIFPFLVPALGQPGGLSAFEVSSSQLTLTVMLIIAVIGVPVMLVYTAIVYRVFAGKTVVHEGY